MQMIIGVLTVDIFLPGCTSLKEKRMAIRSLKDKVRHKYNVSIAEVDFQDKWQRARLGIAQVGGSYQIIEKNVNSIFSIIEHNGMMEVIEHSLEFV